MKQIIIGIDPGSHYLGLAVVSSKGDFIYSETIRVSSKLSETERLSYIKNRIQSFLRQILYSSQFGFYKISNVLYEDPHAQNSLVAKILSQVIGVVATKIYEETGVEAKPVSSIKARANLGLRKNANKDEVRKKILEIIKKNEKSNNLSQHEIDAIAIALVGVGKNGNTS